MSVVTRHLAIVAAAVCGCALSQACREIGAPSRVSPGSTTAIAVRQILSTSGCAAAVPDGTGRVRVSVVERSALPFKLPTLDSSNTNAGPAAVLHIIPFKSFGHSLSPAHRVVFACLVPVDQSYVVAIEDAVWSLSEGQAWSAFDRAMSASPTTPLLKPIEMLAGEALRNQLFPNARVTARAAMPRRGSGTSGISPTGRPLFDDTPPDGFVSPQSDTVKPQIMGPVQITADRTYYVFDDTPVFFEPGQHHTFSDLIDVVYIYNTGPDCADASLFAQGQEEEANKMNDYSYIIRDVSNVLQQFSCQKTGDKRLCIDFFIMADRAAIFGGDNRNFNPDAGYRASRIQFYFNPATGSWEVKYNSSKEIGLNGDVLVTSEDSARLFRPDSDVVISHADSIGPGSWIIKVTFYENFCPSRNLCPTIDAKVFLRTNASAPGGYDVFWKRDGFPSMGVYSLNAAQTGFDTMAQDPEKVMTTWTNWLALIDHWNQSIHLPPGCNWQ